MMIWTLLPAVWRQYIEDIKNSQKGRPHPDKQASYYHMISFDDMHETGVLWKLKYEVTFRLLYIYIYVFSLGMMGAVNLILH